jgi:hypothetical protein
MTVMTAGATLAVYVPFNLVFKTNLITEAADEILQTGYHLVNPTNIDMLRVGIPIGCGAVGYVLYILLNFTNAVTN